MLYKYKDYQVLIDFDTEKINDGIYLELKKQIKSTVILYSTTITEKYLLNEIKVIKKIEDLFNIIKLSFNKEKSESRTINLEIIENIENIENDIIEKDNIILKYNIYIKNLDFNIDFEIILNKTIIQAPEIFKKDNINYEDIIEKLIDLDYKYNKLKNKYDKIKYHYYYFGDVKISNKNKYFYFSQSVIKDIVLKDKYIKFINRSKHANHHNYGTGYYFDIQTHDKKYFLTNNCNQILYNIKHLFLNNVCLNNCYYIKTNINNINIKKYEIKIDIDLYMFTYNNIQKADLKLETETDKNHITYDQRINIFNSCTDFRLYVIYDCSINYLIIHQDMHRFTHYIKEMNITNGIILNNCKLLAGDIELQSYCKLKNIDLIINFY